MHPHHFIAPWFSLMLLINGSAVAAQEIRAVTEDGRKVVLSSDGRWKFAGKEAAALSPAPSASPSPYQTAVKRYSVKFDTANWVMETKAASDESNKAMFRHKSLPLYAMVIADEMPAPTQAIREVILHNAQSAGASTLVVKEEFREVDGKSVGNIRFTATMKGLEFMFDTVYFGGDDGNIQVGCFTGLTIFAKYETACRQFQAGLSIK